jgi:hypothetical protein
MSTLVLHVGMHKTGSTSIQNSLQGYARSRVRYLDLGPPNHSIPMWVAFSDAPQPEKLGLHARLGRSAEDIEAIKQETLARLQKELSKPGIDKFVISGEGITQLSAASLAQLKTFSSRYVDSINVFAYVREPEGFGISEFQQRVKAGYGGYAVRQPNYRTTFEKFIDVFGADGFTAKAFSRDALKGGSVVADFCAMWGIPFDPQDEVTMNESLSAPAVRLLHLFNREGEKSIGSPRLIRARQRMIGALSKHFEGRFSPPGKVAAVDADDVEWLRKHLGVSVPGSSDATERERTAAFREYVNALDRETIEKYRALLANLKIPTGPTDVPIELLSKHFEASLKLSAASDPVLSRMR